MGVIATCFSLGVLAGTPAAGGDKVARQLHDFGFSRIVPAKATSDQAVEILGDFGYASFFDVETGMFPNHHDVLLDDLAELVSPVMKDVVFDELSPPEDDDESPYELIARFDGKELRVKAQNLGDWYDLEAVLQLLDEVKAARKLDVRFAVLETGDQTAIVVGGPAVAVDAAVSAGLLKVAGASDAERAGKAFEEQALKSLGDNAVRPAR